MPDRTKTHGPYKIQADVAEALREVLYPMFPGLPRYQRAALTLIMEKVSRIMVGKGNHIDHWLDIAGYCERVIEELKKQEAHGKE
jgi:hypothetical protein